MLNTGDIPWGTKWSNICCVLLIHPKIINLNHSGRASDNVIDKCLVLVNTYGNRPRNLLNIIYWKQWNGKEWILFTFYPKGIL